MRPNKTQHLIGERGRLVKYLPMKTAFALSISALLTLSTLAADEVILGTFASGGKEYVFAPPDSVSNIPKWDGISEDIPLPFDKALKILQEAAKKDHGEIPPLRSIRLTQNYFTKIYHYQADFILPDAADPRSYYLLLLDGTVVRLTEKKD